MTWAKPTLAELAEAEDSLRAEIRSLGSYPEFGDLRDELLDQLAAVRCTADEIRESNGSHAAATRPARARTTGAGRPAVPATNRRKSLKLTRDLVIAADVAVVAYVEKVLMKPQAVHGHLVHTAPRELVVVGLVFALPAILAVLVSWLRSRGTAAPAAPSRPASGYPFTRIGGPR